MQKTNLSYKSLGRLPSSFMLALMLGLCPLLPPVAAVAADADSIILHFPKEYSLGSLSTYRAYKKTSPQQSYRGYRVTYFARAQGDVKVPRGAELGLALSFDGGRKILLLDQLPPDIVQHLTIMRLEVDDHDFKQLRCLSYLKSLDIEDTDVTDKGFEQLAQCQKLEALSLNSSLATGKTLAVIGKLKTLERLVCEQDNFDSDSLASLSGLNRLSILRLTSVKINDAGIPALTHLSNLCDVALAINKITDKGVDCLSKLKKIEELNLSSTSITVKSADALAKIPHLKKLLISFRDFTPAQLAIFKAKLPLCRIKDGSKTGASLEVFAPLH